MKFSNLIIGILSGIIIGLVIVFYAMFLYFDKIDNNENMKKEEIRATESKNEEKEKSYSETAKRETTKKATSNKTSDNTSTEVTKQKKIICDLCHKEVDKWFITDGFRLCSYCDYIYPQTYAKCIECKRMNVLENMIGDICEACYGN